MIRTALVSGPLSFLLVSLAALVLAPETSGPPLPPAFEAAIAQPTPVAEDTPAGGHGAVAVPEADSLEEVLATLARARLDVDAVRIENRRVDQFESR